MKSLCVFPSLNFYFNDILTLQGCNFTVRVWGGGEG